MRQERVKGYYDYVFKKIISNPANYRRISEIVIGERIKAVAVEKYCNLLPEKEIDGVCSFVNRTDQSEFKREELAIAIKMNPIQQHEGKELTEEELFDTFAGHADKVISAIYRYKDYWNEKKYRGIYIWTNKNFGVSKRVGHYVHYNDKGEAIRGTDLSIIYQIYISEVLMWDYETLNAKDKLLYRLMEIFVTEDIEDFLNDEDEGIRNIAKVICDINQDSEERKKAIILQGKTCI